MLAQREGTRAKEQARLKMQGIVGLINRLHHAEECGHVCDLPDVVIAEELEIHDVDDDDREEYHDEDDARQRIDEHPLDIEVRSDWHHPGDQDPPREYMILLCTGGPAVRIVGDLNEHGEPDTARIEYQDWFTYWERLPINREQENYLLDYARCFYFGE